MPVLSIPREALPLADFAQLQQLIMALHRAGGEVSMRTALSAFGTVSTVDRGLAHAERTFRFRDTGFTARKIDNGIAIPISLSWANMALSNYGQQSVSFGAVVDLMRQADHVRFWYGGIGDNRMELLFTSGVVTLDGKPTRFVGNELRVARDLSEFDVLGSRDRVSVLRDRTTQKLHWTFLPNGSGVPGGCAVLNGPMGASILSDGFAAEELLVCAVTYDTDRTSYYWHPSKGAIRKLNNTCSIQAGANKTTTIEGTTGEFISATRHWLAPQGQIVEEIVLHGAGVPTDHKLVNESRRRRVLSWTGESMVASTAYHCYGATSLQPLSLQHPYKLHTQIIGDMRENRMGLFLRTLSVDSYHNNELAHRNDAMYRIVRTISTSPLASDAPEGALCYAASAHDGRYHIMQRMEALPADPGVDFKAYQYGDKVVIFDGTTWCTDTTQRRAMARGWAMGNNNLETGNPFSGEKLEQLVDALAAKPNHYEGIDSMQYEGWAWLPEWGTPPGIRARHDRYPERTDYVPPCDMHRVQTCACCGATVANIHNRDITLNMPGNGDPQEHVSLCHHCQENHAHGSYRGFFQCADCNEFFHRSSQSERHDVCEGCFEDNYDECERCGTWTHTVQLVEGVCRSCRNQTSRLLEYSYRPKLVFHRVAQEPMVFGCEIELEGEEGSTSNDVAFAASRVLDYPGCKNFLIAKRDGSLSCGAEFVTQPFSWEWFLDNKQRFVDIFENMRARGFTAKRSCGLHVHVSRQPHSHLEEFRALQLVYAHPEKWRAMSGRVVDNYCKFDGPHTGFKERVRVARERSRFGDRYVALNPTDRQTLEWRIWSGTGQFDKFESALATVVAAHTFVRSGATGVKPSFEKFREFCKNHDQFGQRTAPRLALAV
jgi:hypothetical protein